MNYFGDIAEDGIITLFFTTNDGDGGAVAPSSAFEAADVKIYKDGGAIEKTSANGITMTSPFDSITGLHVVTIDTSNDAGDAGFWVTGSDYVAVLSPDETVDTQTVVAVIGSFSIKHRFMRGTDSAALASVCSEGRLSKLDAGNLPADIDALLARLNAARAGYLDELAAGNIPTDLAAIAAYVGELETRLTAARAAVLDNLPISVLGIGGSVEPAYARHSGRFNVYRGDGVSVPALIKGDITAEDLYFSAKDSLAAGSAFAIPLKPLSGAELVVVDGVTYTQVLIPFTYDEIKDLMGDYESEIKKWDGVGDPVTAWRATLSIPPVVADKDDLLAM